MDTTVIQATETAPVRSRSLSRSLVSGKLAAGLAMVAGVVVVGVAGRALWDVSLARAASSPLNLPPWWLPGGSLAHPLGTENSGRDMLALVIAAAPATLGVGVVVGAVSMVVGTFLGFVGGYLGGPIDYVIRTLSDTAMTIPSLAILIVVSSYVRELDVVTMALIIALFAWAGPTRSIRAQVLTMREQGYVRMARLSAQSGLRIMFQEMMPNLLPYLAAGFVGSTSAGIMAAVGLESLGLGPQRIPTLGTTIYDALQASAILRGMWWWWLIPTLILVVIFVGMFLITTGLDEVANPRLRGRSS